MCAQMLMDENTTQLVYKYSVDEYALQAVAFGYHGHCSEKRESLFPFYRHKNRLLISL